jgi:hypothetical protein
MKARSARDAARTERGKPMTEMATQDHAPKREARMVADDVVTANGLATHLGMTRQNVARLTAEAVIEQRSDGRYDQTASRLKYIKHLRAEHRRSPRVEAEAEHTRVKAELLKIKVMEKQKQLVKREEADALLDQVAGLTLTHLSSWPARIAGRDLVLRQKAEGLLRELRAEIAKACTAMADQVGEPPLEQQV